MPHIHPWLIAATTFCLLAFSQPSLAQDLDLGVEEFEDDEVLDMEADYALDPIEVETLLADGRNRAEDDDYLGAALRFFDVTTGGDPSLVPVQQAQFELGVSLYELGLYQAALLQFEGVVEVGAGHGGYRSVLPYLLFISRASDGETSVLSRIATYPPEFYPEEYANELHFLVGQYYFAEGSMDDALVRFQEVNEEDGDFYSRAQYLQGVIHIQESRLKSDPTGADAQRLKLAAEAFKAVLRYQRDQGSSEIIDKVSAMATLALGRLFFSTRQYGVAVRYYDRVDQRDSDWLNALFEVSWVYFQLKNYPRSLGNLHTLNSPYFTDQYFPESRVLQALILFYNCRYDEADEVVQAFVQDYYPLMTELKEQVEQFDDPNAFYQYLARLSKGEESAFSSRFTRIFNAALADRRLRRRFQFVSLLNQEVERLRALKTLREEQLADEGRTGPVEPLFDALLAELTGYRSLSVGEAGDLAQARLKRVLKELKQHLAGALKIKGETLKARRGVQADSVRGEQAAAASARTEIRVDSEHMEWPFTGEYWRDELGSYLYDISSTCDNAGASAP